MMTLAGYAPGSEFDIWMLNPSTMRATGPFTYTLDQEHVDATRRELDGVTRAYGYFSKQDDPTQDDGWNDPKFWLEHYGLESNSGAFRFPTLDASGEIEKRVRAERRAAAALSAAKADYELASQLVFTHVDEQLAAAEKAGEVVKGVTAYGATDVVTYGRKSNGAKQVTVRPRDAAQTAA